MKPIITEPEFCPNKDCRFHDRACAGEQQWYILFGTFDTLCRGTIHSTNDLSWLLEHLYGCCGARVR